MTIRMQYHIKVIISLLCCYRLTITNVRFVVCKDDHFDQNEYYTAKELIAKISDTINDNRETFEDWIVEYPASSYKVSSSIKIDVFVHKSTFFTDHY